MRSSEVQAFEVVAKRVLEMDADDLDQVWFSTFPVEIGSVEDSLSELAWLEKQLRKWAEAVGEDRAEQERYDALPGVLSFWQRIDWLARGVNYLGTRHPVRGPIISRLMRKRAIAVGWRPPEAHLNAN